MGLSRGLRRPYGGFHGVAGPTSWPCTQSEHFTLPHGILHGAPAHHAKKACRSRVAPQSRVAPLASGRGTDTINAVFWRAAYACTLVGLGIVRATITIPGITAWGGHLWGWGWGSSGQASQFGIGVAGLGSYGRFRLQMGRSYRPYGMYGRILGTTADGLGIRRWGLGTIAYTSGLQSLPQPVFRRLAPVELRPTTMRIQFR